MNHGKRILCVCVTIGLLVGGCIGANKPQGKIDYYTLEYAPPVVENLVVRPLIVRVESFRAASFYESTKIVYQEQAFQKDAYYYHRWRARPAELVANLLTRDLQQACLFEAVVGPASRARASYAVEGFIEDFFELDDMHGCSAVLTLNINVVPEGDFVSMTPVLMQKRYHVQVPCEKKHPRALVEAMSKAMAKISSVVIADIYASLSAGTEP
jgi:cholesterol transport system auxiliary component